MNIELVDTIADTSGGGLALRTQSSGDAAKLLAFVPKDQTRYFSAKWDGVRLCFAEIVNRPSSPAEAVPRPPLPLPDEDDAEYLRCRAMNEADLKTEAAVRGVKWDGRASHDTMARRTALAAQPVGANK